MFHDLRSISKIFSNFLTALGSYLLNPLLLSSERPSGFEVVLAITKDGHSNLKIIYSNLMQ